MMRALYSSVAGLKTHQTKMDVIGNNIANVNTVGFKSTRVTFSTMMYQTLSSASGANNDTGTGGVNAKQIGLGSNFASTTVAIASGGATESTGNAFDLKIADTSTTSFFIVNNGTSNVFTRAGAFYVDGAGNLCMESTGYTVMGWQVDANGNIIKDTVSPLKIMSATNQVSQPEFTTKALCKGILDDNSTNVNLDTGYAMNLNFYDNLGYAYVAKFAVTKSAKDGQFVVNLTNILDSQGKSILTSKTKLGDLFGTGNAGNQQGSNVNITNNYTMKTGMQNALKRLAETWRETADGSGQVLYSSRTYTYSAEEVNDYFGFEDMGKALPAGYKVTYTEYLDTSTNEASTANYTTKIYDALGNDVTEEYLSTVQDASKQLVSGTPSDTENQSTTTISFTKDASEIVSNWVEKSEVILETDADGNKTAQLSDSQINTLADVFGITSLAGASSVTVQQGAVTSDGYNQYTFTIKPNSSTNDTTAAKLSATKDNADAYTKVYALTDSDIKNKSYLTIPGNELSTIFTTNVPSDAELHYTVGNGGYTIVTPSTDGLTLQFSLADGTLQYVGQNGQTSAKLKLASVFTDGNFSDIDIDFSALKNLANSGSSTAALSSGDSDGDGTGKKVGKMTGLSVDTSGKVFGTYSNGNTVLLGQIAVARFANASGLESIGDNCFQTTLNSGEFDGIGEEITSDGSTISTGELEMSNVDLATEFTNMITTQRGYQANSRVISTSDSILEELVNLKR